MLRYGLGITFLPFQLQRFNGVEIDFEMLPVAMGENRFAHGQADGFHRQRLMDFPEILQAVDFTRVQSLGRFAQ